MNSSDGYHLQSNKRLSRVRFSSAVMIRDVTANSCFISSGSGVTRRQMEAHIHFSKEQEIRHYCLSHRYSGTAYLSVVKPVPTDLFMELR